MRHVDAFLAEVAIERPKTLFQLNERFEVWLETCYQAKPHAALEGNVSPEVAFRSDNKAIRFVDAAVLADAFLHAETRRVDKSGCISFLSRKYEVGLTFIGCTVDVVYDPADTSVLTIEYEGHTPWQVHPLVMGERTGGRPKLPEHLTPLPADSSRLLHAAEERHQQRRREQLHAVSYRSTHKEGSGDV